MTMGKIARGHQSEVRDEDLKIESGRIVNCDVRGGVVQDLALLKFDGVPEASALSQAIQVMTARLGKAMLLESESQPKGERVTAYQVDRIAQEIRGITGGANVSITEMQIPPLLRRLTYQMERDKLLAPLPKEAVKFTLVTGSAAMARAARAGGVLDFVNACVALGDAALARINQGVLVDVLARYKGVDEPGLIKSDEQMAQEQQAALAQQAAQAAIGQAIASTGKIAEQQANQGGSPLGA